MLTMLAAAALAASTPSPIYHYIRSNRDGSEPEHVVHYRPSKRTISVYKWVERCTTAAYVTADMDDEIRSGRVFFAGRVARNGTQKQFGRLTLDPQTLTLSADVTPPGGTRIEAKHALRATSFLLYDFDFADLNSFLQEHMPTFDFSYALPVIWPADASIFRDLGMLRAHFVGGGTSPRPRYATFRPSCGRSVAFHRHAVGRRQGMVHRRSTARSTQPHGI